MGGGCWCYCSLNIVQSAGLSSYGTMVALGDFNTQGLILTAAKQREGVLCQERVGYLTCILMDFMVYLSWCHMRCWHLNY